MSIPMQYAQPSGSRRLSTMMLAAREQADAFINVPRPAANPFRYLAAFQEAEPYLGLPPQAYKLVAWLVKMTMAHDWEQGARPICWPSAARQAEFLGLSPGRVKTLNRALFEAGIFVIRDSETGKRYGRRNEQGRIIEAYGFDLSPLAYRYNDFIRLAAEAKIERDTLRGLKKRATRARRGIAQIGEALAAAHAVTPEWYALALETSDLVASIRTTRTSIAMAPITAGLESRLSRAELILKATSKSDENNPEGLVSDPHNISTNKSFYPKDTVIAGEGSSAAEGAGSPRQPAPQRTEDYEDTQSFRPFERVEKLHPLELVELAPKLAEHIGQPYPDWHQVVDAAGGGLRDDLGVSKPLWGEACRILGRQRAAVTLAIVSTKPREHFTRGAGGYFAAMVKRAERGELHLDRSLWKLRREKWGSASAPRPSGGRR